MLQALVRTLTEVLDSKKAAYSFIATLGASVLHLYFGVSVQDAMLLVSPLAVATVAQAHVDAKTPTSTTRAPTARGPVPVIPLPTTTASGMIDSADGTQS